MKMVRVLIQLPQPLKAELDALREHGTTASGFVRALIEREFRKQPTAARKVPSAAFPSDADF